LPGEELSLRLSYCCLTAVLPLATLARIFHTPERRVRARGLQERRCVLVGRVPSRGAVLAFPSECEISGLGFETPHSGGMAENSTPFRRWVCPERTELRRFGLQSRHASAKAQLRSRVGRSWRLRSSRRRLGSLMAVVPDLKRWAIVICSSQAGARPRSAMVLPPQFLPALDKNVRAPIAQRRWFWKNPRCAQDDAGLRLTLAAGEAV